MALGLRLAAEPVDRHGVIGATIFGIRLVLWALFSDEPPYPALYVILAGASVSAIAVGMSKERRSGQR
jgi:hypothetical protein